VAFREIVEARRHAGKIAGQPFGGLIVRVFGTLASPLYVYGVLLLMAGGLVWAFRRLTVRVAALRWAFACAAAALGLLAGANIVARNRDWRDDFTLFTQTLAIEPHASMVRTDLGVLEWEKHDRAEAERQWRLALVDMPDSAVALSNLGLAMLEKQRYEEAAAYLQKAIDLRPRFAAPHIHLGRVYVAQGDMVRAEAEFRGAVEIYPLSTQARNALGKFYFDQEKFTQAEEQYRASVDSLPNAEAWNRLGNLYARQDRQEPAEHAWRKVLELSPFDTDAHLALGNVCLASGRSAEAEREYRAVLLMDPRNAAALEGLAKLNAKAQQVPAVLR